MGLTIMPPRISTVVVTPPTSVVDSDMTGVVGIIYDITGLTAARTFTLPDAVAIGDTITITNSDGSFDAFDLTVDVINAGTVNKKANITLSRGFAEIEFKAISTGAGSQWSALGDVDVACDPPLGEVGSDIAIAGSATNLLYTNGTGSNVCSLLILHNTDILDVSFDLHKVLSGDSPTVGNKFISATLSPGETIILDAENLPVFENSGDMLNLAVSTVGKITAQLYMNGETQNLTDMEILKEITTYAAGSNVILNGAIQSWLYGTITNTAAVANTVQIFKMVPAGATSLSNRFIKVDLAIGETLTFSLHPPGIHLSAADSVVVESTDNITVQFYGRK